MTKLFIKKCSIQLVNNCCGGRKDKTLYPPFKIKCVGDNQIDIIGEDGFYSIIYDSGFCLNGQQFCGTFEQLKIYLEDLACSYDCPCTDDKECEEVEEKVDTILNLIGGRDAGVARAIETDTGNTVQGFEYSADKVIDISGAMWEDGTTVSSADTFICGYSISTGDCGTEAMTEDTKIFTTPKKKDDYIVFDNSTRGVNLDMSGSLPVKSRKDLPLSFWLTENSIIAIKATFCRTVIVCPEDVENPLFVTCEEPEIEENPCDCDVVSVSFACFCDANGSLTPAGMTYLIGYSGNGGGISLGVASQTITMHEKANPSNLATIGAVYDPVNSVDILWVDPSSLLNPTGVNIYTLVGQDESGNQFSIDFEIEPLATGFKRAFTAVNWDKALDNAGGCPESYGFQEDDIFDINSTWQTNQGFSAMSIGENTVSMTAVSDTHGNTLETSLTISLSCAEPTPPNLCVDCPNGVAYNYLGSTGLTASGTGTPFEYDFQFGNWNAGTSPLVSSEYSINGGPLQTGTIDPNPSQQGRIARGVGVLTEGINVVYNAITDANGLTAEGQRLIEVDATGAIIGLSWLSHKGINGGGNPTSIVTGTNANCVGDGISEIALIATLDSSLMSFKSGNYYYGDTTVAIPASIGDTNFNNNHPLNNVPVINGFTMGADMVITYQGQDYDVFLHSQVAPECA